MRPRGFYQLTLDALRIDDEHVFESVEHFVALRETVREAGLTFRVAPEASVHAEWSRVLFLNLTYWHGSEGNSDALASRNIPADVVTHVAWHYLAQRALLGDFTGESMLMGECIASAYDLFLLGSLWCKKVDCDFVSALREALFAMFEEQGMTHHEFELWLDGLAHDPERAFEDLRALLFDLCVGLLASKSLDDAVAVFDAHSDRRFAGIVHHYELSNWLLHTRAYAATRLDMDPQVRALDASLRAAARPVQWLADTWIATPPSH
ncbi:MAG: hypothetical protein Q8Q09_06130 [Deltaproteobacteria bacterium]|nr:hypothetical protein [Deltaproteobacteria bacterium]